MATLFNTKISATYEGLFKTIDNAAITASLKELTDGSGNQSGLYVNTAGDFKVSNILEWGSLKDTGTGVTITRYVTSTDGIENFDNNTSLPTSAAVKLYVDSKFATSDTLQEVLSFGNTTGGNDIVVSASDDITFTDTSKILMGASSDLQIYHDGSNSFIRDLGTGNLLIDSNGAELKLRVNTTENALIANSNGSVELYYNNIKRFETQTDGSKVTCNLVVTGTITGSGGSFLPLAGGTMTGNTLHGDNVKSLYGTGSDLEIYHNGSHSYIDEVGTGSFYLRTNGGAIYLQDISGNPMAQFTDGGGSHLMYNGNLKLSTANTGVSITGSLSTTTDVTVGANATFVDNGKALFGAGSDLQIYHDGSNSFIKNTTGVLNIQSSIVAIENASGVNYFVGVDGGKTALSFNGTERLETVTDGAKVTGNLEVTGTITGSGGSFLPLAGGTMTGNTIHNDNVKSIYGTASDGLEIFHDGGHSYITDTGTGSLFIQADASLNFKSNSQNENWITATSNGKVDLWYNGNRKFETTNTGISVTGNGAFTGSVQIPNAGQLQLGTGLHMLLQHNSANGFIKNLTGQLNIDQAAVTQSLVFRVSDANSLDTTALTISRNADASFGRDVTIAGNLTVNGTTTTVNSQTLAVVDPLIQLAKDNTANSLDIGLYGDYNDGTDRFLGLFSDASDSNKFKLFKGTTVEPTTTVNIGATGYEAADLVVAGLESSSFISTGTVSATSFISTTDAGININGLTLTRIAANTAFRTSGGLETLGLLRSYAGLNVAQTATFGGNATFVGNVTANGYLTLTGQATPQIFMESNTAGTPIWTLIAGTNGYFTIGRSGVSNDFYFDPNGNASFAGSIYANTIYSATNSAYYIDVNSTGVGLNMAGDISLSAGKKLKYNANSFITPENNTSGAEISTAGTFIVKTGSTPTLGLTIDASQNSTFGGSATIRKTALGGSTAMDDGTLVLGAGTTDYFSFRLNSGADLYFDKSYGGVAANVFSIDRSTTNGDITFAGDVIVNGGNVKIKKSVASNETMLGLEQSGVGTTILGSITYDQSDDAMRLLNNSDFGGTSLILGTRGQDIFKIDYSGNSTFAGNVGIGAAPVGNPGTNILAVGTAGTTAGGIQLWAANNQAHYLQFGDANSGGEVYRGGIGYNHSSETLLFLQNSSTALSFTGSQAATFAGDVGVGAAPLQSKLDILNNGDYDSHTGHGLAINSNASNAYTSMYMGADDSVDAAYIQSAGRNTSFTSKKLLLNPNGGNVGIGTDSPEQLLTVAGGSITASGNTGTARQILELTTASTVATIKASYQGASSFGDLAFQTGGTERMRIDSSGNVGFNVTSNLNLSNFQISTGSGLGENVSVFIANTSGVPYANSATTTQLGLGFLSGTANYVATGQTLGNLQFYGQANDAGYGGASIKAVVTTGGNVNRSSHAVDMVFSTMAAGVVGNEERMRIDSNGSIGMGANSSAYRLRVKSDATVQNGIYLSAGTGNGNHSLYVEDKDGTAEYFAVRGDGQIRFNASGTGNVRIGTGTSATGHLTIEQGGNHLHLRNVSQASGRYWNFDVASDSKLYILNEAGTGVYIAHGATSWTANSDESLKENIKPLNNVLDKIKDYRCVEYNLKSDKNKGKKIGFIAQDWENDFAPIVNKDEEGLLGMKYTETIPVLLKAIQELKAEVDSLKQQCNCKN